MSSQTTFAYDKLLYPNYLHTQTHPDRLATMAKFYGMTSPAIDNCRVLELGCGTGSSLMSFANDLPDSQFVGVDLSEKQIELGKKAVETIGIDNLDLIYGDITKLSRKSLGEFDYIIAHGVYSWVPDFVRDRILALCREVLTENGIAYVSYNTLPGCHFRQIARGMMMYHTKHLDHPIEKVNNSLGLLKFMSETTTKEGYKKILEDEFKDLSERNFENIYHDDLSEENHPVYFHQFVEHAEQHDLQFLSEIEYPTNISRKIAGGDVLFEIANNRLELEQYVDFLDGRKFRQTLLCRKEVKLSPGSNKNIVRDLYIASSLAPASPAPDITTDKHEIFRGLKKETIEIDHPLSKAMLVYLHEIWAQSVKFDEAVKIAADRISAARRTEFHPDADDLEIAKDIFYNIFCTGKIRLESHQMNFQTSVSEKPTANRIARWNAVNNDLITTLLCTSIAIPDPLGRKVIELMDGTRTLPQLREDLKAYIKSEEFDRPPEVKAQILEAMPAQFENNLKFLASMGILEA